jgi:thiol-disulfide isomerase/thioredoxin
VNAQGTGTKAPDTGYKLDFRIKELKDTTVLLGYYYGESTFVRDTARSDKEGKFSFTGPKRLERGVYFLVLNRTKLFDPGFVVGQDQQFLMETSGPDYIRNMKVTGDEDNKLFFENMVFNGDRHKEAEPFMKTLRDSTLTEAQKKEAREGFANVDKKVQAHQVELVKKYPQTVTAKLVNANRRVEVPDPPKRADGTIDSMFQYRYYKKHFFDNFDITDDALIRLPSPAYQEKVAEYLDKLVLQTPDSLMAAIDDLASRVKANPETYKYLVYSCVYKYQRPSIMGLDEVFVRIFDKYYASGEMDFWVNATMKKTMKDYADKLRHSLVGKTGANLVMQDQSFQKRALYDIKKKYALIYFFDPDCGHCKEETPRLVNFYKSQKDKFNLEVFAVSLDTSMVKMRDYIRDMKMTWITVNGPRSYQGSLFDHYYAETTPMLYILDDKKKIIAKGLPAERIEEFLTNYEKFEKRRAAMKSPGTSPGK